MIRRGMATVMLVFCAINAPLSMFTYAKDEPITVLLLSWGAMIWTSIDILFTAQVKEDNDNDRNAGPHCCSCHQGS